MLKIGDKVFLNLQEAVGWLLANNALPFQSTANYIADTEIAKSTIVNPSPAEIKVGSLVLFADSKVGTVSGVSSNGFMVSSEYTDIQLALAYISNIEINASGKLISTLSDGTTIDAGRIKMVSNFSIDGSQHLIAHYNDGTSTDLGAIFTGNLSISGNITATGTITGNAISSGTGLFTNVAVDNKLTADVVEQSSPSFQNSFTLNSSFGTVTNIYNRFIVINGILWTVITISITNDTGADKTGKYILNGSNWVDAAIGAKIYDMASKNLNELVNERTLIAHQHVKAYNNKVLANITKWIDLDLYIMRYDNRTNQMIFSIATEGLVDVTVENGETIYLSARIPLTLLGS